MFGLNSDARKNSFTMAGLNCSSIKRRISFSAFHVTSCDVDSWYISVH